MEIVGDSKWTGSVASCHVQRQLREWWSRAVNLNRREEVAVACAERGSWRLEGKNARMGRTPCNQMSQEFEGSGTAAVAKMGVAPACG